MCILVILGSNTKWNTKMEEMLLEIYRDHMGRFRTAAHEADVWRFIQRDFNNQGFRQSYSQLKEKFSRLESWYVILILI